MTVFISLIGRAPFRIYNIHRIIEEKDEIKIVGYTHTETPTVLSKQELKDPLIVSVS